MHPLARSVILLLAPALAAAQATTAAQATPATPATPATWPTRAWPRATPEAVQLNAAPLFALDSAVRAGTYGNVDDILVIRNGAVIFERHYARDYAQIAAGKTSYVGCGPGTCAGRTLPAEFNYFDPLTHPRIAGRSVHSLQSITKSINATLIGALLHAGRIRGVDVPFLPLLGARASSATDPRLQRATLSDLLTMRSGIEWHEQDRPLGPTNTTVQLEHSDDWVRFTLSQPMDSDPGTKWAYSSGGSHLLSAIIGEVTRGDPLDAAKALLFDPLGVPDVHWKRTPEGLRDGEGGLYLTAESVAKIGLLYLRDGVWDGRRILPAGWAREATRAHTTNGPPQNRGYGYQWWRLDQQGTEIWAGLGFGGQFLLLFPEHDVIAVSFAWNVYGDRVPGVSGALVQAVLRGVAPR